MKQKWLIFRASLISIFLLTSSAAAWLFFIVRGHDITALALVVVAALTSVVAYSFATFRSHTQNRILPVALGVSRMLDQEAVDFFFGKDGPNALEVAQAMTFIDAIVYPREVFERISERAQPYHRSIKLEHTYTMAVPRKPTTPEGPDFVIPLFLFPKDQLQDGLRVYTGDKDRVSTLSSSDVLVFAAAVVRSLVHAAGPTAYSNYLGALEGDVFEVLSGGSVIDLVRLEQIRSRILGLQPNAGNMEVLDTAASLIAELATFHPICATIKASDVRAKEWPWTFRFKMEYRTIPPLRAVGKDPWWQRLADAARLAMGVRLNRIFIPIPNANRTRSFHLQVEGPPGTYLARQGTVPAEEDLQIRIKMQPRRAQRRAHAYIQNLAFPSEVLFATQFYERSPGSFASTSASAWAAAVVVGCLAIQQVEAISTGIIVSGGNLLPALLAVPIAVASWTRIESGPNPSHPSLLSRALTFLTVILCLCTFTVAVVPGTFWTAPAIVWKLLAAAAIALALISTYAWFMRLAVEHHFSRRGDEAR
jgi:hypothetical protein